MAIPVRRQQVRQAQQAQVVVVLLCWARKAAAARLPAQVVRVVLVVLVVVLGGVVFQALQIGARSPLGLRVYVQHAVLAHLHLHMGLPAVCICVVLHHHQLLQVAGGRLQLVVVVVVLHWRQVGGVGVGVGRHWVCKPHQRVMVVVLRCLLHGLRRSRLHSRQRHLVPLLLQVPHGHFRGRGCGGCGDGMHLRVQLLVVAVRMGMVEVRLHVQVLSVRHEGQGQARRHQLMLVQAVLRVLARHMLLLVVVMVVVRELQHHAGHAQGSVVLLPFTARLLQHRLQRATRTPPRHPQSQSQSQPTLCARAN